METSGIKIPKLKGSSNYDIWAIRSKAFLIEKGYYDVLTANKETRTTSKYYQDSIKATALIRLTLEDSPLVQTQFIDDANDLWIQLRALYEPKGFNSEFLICRELFNTTLAKSSNSIEAYLTKIRRYTDQLAAKGLLIPPKVIAAYTLSNLTPEYESTVAIISQTLRSSDAQLDLIQLFGNLVDESRRLKYRDADAEMAMPLTNSRVKGKPRCTYCNKIGHLEEKCWEKHPKLKKGSTVQSNGSKTGRGNGRGSGQGNKRSTGPSNGPTPPRDEEELALHSSSTVRSTGQTLIEGNSSLITRSTGQALIEENRPLEARSTGQEISTKAVALSTRDSSYWYLDSGATRHFCAARSLFSRLEACNITLKWGTAGSVQVKEFGTIRLKFQSTGRVATIKDCLYLPQIGLNLLSLG